MSRLFALSLTLISLAFLTLSPARAANLIRDAEIEATLRFIADPVLRAAGLNPRSIRIIIINNPEMNAFVAGRQTMFIHSGMLMRLDKVEMVQAVIAHEAAHIASGHLISLNTGSSASRAVAIGAVLAGMAAISGRGDAAMAIASGSMHAAGRESLAHSRAAEASADQSSVRFLARAGIDPKAALETLELFRGQEVLGPAHVDPYARTHPLTSQRIQFLRNAVASTQVSNVKPHPNLNYWYARMRAKFEGFIGNPRQSIKATRKAKNGEFAIYKRAIANFRMSNLKAMKKDIAWLLNARPKDAYYQELNGQFLLATGDATGAVNAYRRAAKLSKDNDLILAGLGRALLALDTPAATRESVDVLEKARQTGFPAPLTYQSLAQAYGRLGQNGRASLAISERYALSGRLADAGLHAKRAMGLLAEGTPSWRRANDIALAAKRATAKRK